MSIDKSFKLGGIADGDPEQDITPEFDLQQLINSPEDCLELGLDPDRVKEIIQTSYELSDEELSAMIDEYQSLDEADDMDQVRLTALTAELIKRQTIEAAFEGNDEVEKLRDNMWLLQKKGSTNPVSVVFRKGDQLFVTDPGISWKSKGKNENLMQLEEGLQARVKGIMLTHSHPDHIGNIPAVAGGDTQVYAHGKALWSLLSPDKLLREENVWAKKAQEARGEPKETAGKKPPFPGWQTRAYPLFARAVYGPNMTGIKQESKGDDEQGYKRLPKEPMQFDGYAIEAVHTPGHVPGEVGFWEPEAKIFVCGDILHNTGLGRDQIPIIYLPDSNIYDAIKSLREIESRAPEMLVPAHGEPLRGKKEIAERINEAISILEYVISEVKRINAENPSLSVDEIAKQVFADSRFPKIAQFGTLEKKSMVMTVLRDEDRTAFKSEM